MRDLILIVVLFVSAHIPLSLSAAVNIDGLYEIEIAVENQGPQERQRALRQGLLDIITRLTGSQSLEQFGQMLSVLDSAPRYVEQYRYQREQLIDPEPGVEPGLLLWVRYSRQAIQRLLQEQQLPMWGSHRPETVIWLAVDRQGERNIVSNDSRLTENRALQTHARRRAIPILIPLMDLEDQRRVKVGDIWGGFTAPIEKASKRYTAENILLARLTLQNNGQWQSRWTLLDPDGVKSWQAKGADLDKVIAQGIDGLADILSARYALKDHSQISYYRLRVDNVDNLVDYDSVNRLLSGLVMIDLYRPQVLTDGYVIYAVSVRGKLEHFEQALVLQNRLQRVDTTVIVQEPPVKPVVLPAPDPASNPAPTPVPEKNLPELLHYRLAK